MRFILIQLVFALGFSSFANAAPECHLDRAPDWFHYIWNITADGKPVNIANNNFKDCHVIISQLHKLQADGSCEVNWKAAKDEAISVSNRTIANPKISAFFGTEFQNLCREAFDTVIAAQPAPAADKLANRAPASTDGTRKD